MKITNSKTHYAHWRPSGMIYLMSLAPIPIGMQHDPGSLFKQGELVIQPDARRKHMAIFGTTGAGKSTLMLNMIATDVAAGMGCTVIDPHGQLVEEILTNHIPRWRSDDVIYFNPKDPARAIPLNLLDSPSRELEGLVVDNIISIFKQLWPDAFGAGARKECGVPSIRRSRAPREPRSGEQDLLGVFASRRLYVWSV